MIDFLIIAVVGVLVGLAIGYIRSQKKKGVRCIGCPVGGCRASDCRGPCPGCGERQS